VVADEERNLEALLRPRAGDHRPGLLALQQHGPRVEVLRRQVEHLAVAVVDEHVPRAAGEGALDRGVRLADHERDGRRVARIAPLGGQAVADAADALHVDADVDLQATSGNAGPL
jgi:hypothetical protein